MAAPIDKLFIRELERKTGEIIKIYQSEIGDVGCVVWDAALVLSCYLETKHFKDNEGNGPLTGARLVELGSGTGIVGIQAACCGADSIITDLEDFMPLIELNITTNQLLMTGSALARPLPWGEDIATFLPAPNYILLADCIYYEQSVEPLVKTITDLADIKTVTLCCYEERTTGNKPELQRRFFELIEERFAVEEIPMEYHDPVFRSEDIHIMKFTKR